jgi:hypothetical protein
VKTISHSGLVLVRNCLRQYRHAYVSLRIPTRVAPALSFGKLWDSALEAWHYGKDAKDRLQRAAPILDGIIDDHKRGQAQAMLVGYSAQWGDKDIEVIGTQVPFTVPILHPETSDAHPVYSFTGVLDGIIRFQGRLLGLESKTSSDDISPGSPYWQKVTTLDPQVSLYDLGAKQAGYALDGILYDVAKKPALKPKVGESGDAFRDRIALDIQGRPDWYFQRREVVRLEHEARAYQQDLWDYACILTEAENLGRFPRNPDRCRQWGRACEYIGVCAGEASIDDPVLFRAKERDNGYPRPHPARPAA